MSDYLSGQITFTGLGSGTDFTTMIDQLIEVESVHKKQLEYWKESWELKVEALDALNSSILSLKTTLGGMDTVNEFMVKTVDGADSSILSATADSSAEEGVHNVEVFQLAQNSIWMSGSGVAEKDASVVGLGTNFKYSYDDPNDDEGVKNVTLWVPVNTTLENMVNMINTDPDNPGVRASIVSDGDLYYLQMRGMDQGGDANLIISNASFGNLGSFSETQANTDALLKIDGWPTASDAYIHSSSNTLSEAIPGVNLTVKNVGSTQINIDVDQQAVIDNVQTFVDKMNEVRTLFMELTKVGTINQSGSVSTGKVTAEQAGSLMTGNYAVQLVASNLKSITASLAKGFQYFDPLSEKGDKYSTLSQLGILTDADEGSVSKGLLVLDQDKLREVLNENPDAVAQLFAAKDLGGQTVDSGSFKYYSHISGITKPGAYDVSYTVSGGVITGASVAGGEVTIDNGSKTVTVTSGDARGMMFQVLDTDTDGTFGGKVQLKQGKLGEIENLLDDYTDEQSGPMHIVANNYEDIIYNIEKKIDYEDERLDRRAEELKLKFARLEALLGNYDQISKSLSSSITQLNAD